MRTYSSVTEPFLRDVAKRHGLNVLKRITTGNDRCHFATFELTGDQAADAWPEVRAVAAGYTGALALIRLALPTNPTIKDRRPYIEVESIWCDMNTTRADGSAFPEPLPYVVQCTDATSGRLGCFGIDPTAPRIDGKYTAITPVFSSHAALMHWATTYGVNLDHNRAQ